MEAAGGGHCQEALPVNQRVTWEGCSVLLDINDGDRLVFARLSSGATLKIGNKKCSLRALIGSPFGSLFNVKAGPNGSYLARCTTSTFNENAFVLQDKGSWQSTGESKDNRSLVDNNTAQGLSSEDIDAMKRDGATGDDIIKALIANSSTFEKKTSYSQEKYKVKKQKKYAPKVLLRRPFSRSICEAYFKKYPSRIGFLRVDALCLLLSMANVGAYSDVLVLDMVGGLLTGSVAERLGGTGFVCSTYFGTSRNPIDIVRMFNFSSEVNSRIVQASFTDLCLDHKNDDTADSGNQISEAGTKESFSNSLIRKSCIYISEDAAFEEVNVSSEISCASQEISYQKNSLQASQGAHSCLDVESEQDNSITVENYITPGRQASSEVIKSWNERGFTSLIVAAPEIEVESIVVKLVPLLSYSAPFAVYHHCLQSLGICMQTLQASKMAIGLQISEPWLREYQVLPSRTHPHMQMSAFGGYILSGIRVYNDACNEVQ